MLPSLPNLTHHERAVLLRASEKVNGACERAWIAARVRWICGDCAGPFLYDENATPNFCPYCRSKRLLKNVRTGTA